MKIERTKNAARNITFGVAQKIYQVVVPFIMRTVMIYTLGVEYLGLNSLFTSVLSVLSLAELGVGAAMVYSMYKPIAEDDTDTICALMRLYRKYYRIIGIVIAALGLAILPLVPKLIKSDLPSDVNVYILYILSLSATVLSYWLFAYKNCILSAHQRNDLPAKVSLLTQTVQSFIQLIILIGFKNYYAYLITALVMQAGTNICTAIVAVKYYPQYSPRGNLDKSVVSNINKRIRDLFTAKLGNTIVSSADTIVISAFLGLSMLAIYQNYYYIMNAVIGFLLIIFNSITAGVGNSLVVETDEKNYYDFKKLSFLTAWIATVCVSCFICLYQPFMEIWVGKDYLLDTVSVFLFSLYFLLYAINSVSVTYKDAAGIWKYDRFRPLLSGLFNLFLNLSLVKLAGIKAILLSTCISYIIIAIPWLVRNLFKYVFKRSPKEYFAFLVNVLVINVFIGSLSLSITNFFRVNAVAKLLINLPVALVIPNIVLYLIYRKNPLFNDMLNLFNMITKNKFIFILDKLRYKEIEK